MILTKENFNTIVSMYKEITHFKIEKSEHYDRYKITFLDTTEDYDCDTDDEGYTHYINYERHYPLIVMYVSSFENNVATELNKEIEVERNANY